ncbi:unnamed protein product [Echinostoma caproni]|uniref:PKD domain-containing protein n=1 Tax=Echinostoma caproni TaxID=27848 RepID=A0A183AFZ0_9TREM|nr:unnamed protein product [Echinostoma caproni]
MDLKPENDLLALGGRRFASNLPTCDTASLIISGIQARYTGVLPQVNVLLTDTTSFELVKLRVTPTATGSQVFTLPSTWSMQPGDRIGMLFSSTVSPVACTDLTVGTGDLISTTVTTLNPADTIASTSLTRSKKIAQITAWSTIKRDLQISGKMSRPGLQTITLSLYSFRLKNSPFTLTRDIVVGVGFNKTKLVQNDFLVSTEATLALFPHSGVADQYVWDFGDSTPKNITTTRTVTHTYTAVGDYNVIVNMSNAAGFLVVTDTVSISQPLDFRGITVQDATVSVATEIQLQITNVDKVTCLWTIDNQNVCSGETQTCQHTYSSPGLYHIQVNCTNKVNTISRSVVQRAISPIQGLAISTLSFPVGKQQSVIFVFTNGSNMAASLQINEVVIPTTIDYNAREIRSEPLDAELPRVFNYSLDVTNPLSTKNVKGIAAFDIPVASMKVRVNPSMADVNQQITLEVTFDQGTGINVTVDWGDGGKTENQGAKSTEPWIQLTPFMKQYTQTGQYTVTVTAQSGQSTLTTTQVISISGDLGEYKVSPSSTAAPLNQAFSIRLDRTSGMLAVMTTIIIDWGDQSEPLTDQFDEQKSYSHVYSTEMSTTIVITLKNSKGTKTLNQAITVRKAIENFGCIFSPNPALVSQQVSFTISMQTAIEVQLQTTFDTGQPFTSVSLPVASTQVQNYTYPKAGTREVVINAVHPTGNKTCTMAVDVQKPIASMNVAYEPIKESASGTTSVTISFSGTADQFPTSPKYIIDWGDGKEANRGLLSFADMPLNVSRTLSQMRLYKVNVTIFNGVNKIEKIGEVGVFRRILTVDLTLTINATGQPGYGCNSDRFPAGVAVKLTVLADGASDNVAQTTFTITYLTSGNTVSLAPVSSNYQVFTFTEQGLVQINATGSNPISSAMRTKTITVPTTLRGLQLSVPTTVFQPLVEGTLRITFDAISSDTCICVSKSDSMGYLVIPADGQKPQSCSLCPNNKLFIQRPIKNVLTIPVRYDAVGSDLITVEARNPFASVSNSLFVTITAQQCSQPELIFAQTGIEFPNTPLMVQDDRPTTIQARLSTSNCVLGRQNSMNWTLQEIDPDTLRSIKEIDISTLPNVQTMTLVIPSSLLGPGEYAANIYVSTQSSQDPAPIVIKKTAYLSKLAPSLIVQFDEGNPISISVGLDKPVICFDPQSHSSDPVIGDRNMPQVSTANSISNISPC